MTAASICAPTSLPTKVTVPSSKVKVLSFPPDPVKVEKSSLRPAPNSLKLYVLIISSFE